MKFLLHNLLLFLTSYAACSFTIHSKQAQSLLSNQQYRSQLSIQHQTRIPPPGSTLSTAKRPSRVSKSRSPTALHVLVEVPEGFFTVSFFSFGLMLSITKLFARARLEERAWEQRLREGRQARLDSDSTLTEIDLRRREAALEWSAYGQPRMAEEQAERQAREQQRKRRRVRVKEEEDEEEDTTVDPRQHRMTEEEIDAFELEYAIQYDPYYDDPYAEEELPDEPHTVDKRYGDRIYDSGEIFYKDAETGLFYRQGAKPRNIRFWK